jgi:hypothetical protein
MPGMPGSKSGPAVKPGTVGSSSTLNQGNPTVRQRAHIKACQVRPPARQPQANDGRLRPAAA